MKHTEVTNFHYIDFNTNNRVPTQVLNTQYGHQKITEQKVALDSSNRPILDCISYDCFASVTVAVQRSYFL